MLPEPQVAVQLGLGLRNLRDPAHPTMPAVRACVRACTRVCVYKAVKLGLWILGVVSRVVGPESGGPVLSTSVSWYLG